LPLLGAAADKATLSQYLHRPVPPPTVILYRIPPEFRPNSGDIHVTCSDD
jgi:hypothetical protein